MKTMRSVRTLAMTALLLPACEAATGATDVGDDAAHGAAQDAVTTATSAASAESAESTDMTIAAPLNGKTVTSPVSIRAHVTECGGEPTISFGYSVDEESAITEGSSPEDIDTTAEVPSGTHTFRFKAWTAKGICPVLTTTVTVSGTTDGITVLSPSNGQSVTSPVDVKATVATCGGVKTTAFGYSLDSESAITWGSATSIAHEDSTIPPGDHVIRFKAWAGSILCPVIDVNVTVQAAPSGYDGSSSIPSPPSDATLFSKIEDLSSWSASTGAQSSCPNGVTSSTCNPPNANFDKTVQHVSDPGTPPPDSDGSAGLFELEDSPAWATCIWGHSIGTSTTVRNFIWDFYVYVTGTDYAASELDFYQILGGQRFMMGTQCDRAANSWDTWDESSQHWIHNTSIACNDILTANAWHHVVMYLTTDSTTNEYTYKTFRIDDVDYVLNQAQPTHPSTWPDGLIGVQVQLDTNATGDGVNEYLEAMKTYAW
jgi:hypothetical protein